MVKVRKGGPMMSSTRMRRISIAVLALAFAACGGGGGDGETVPVPPANDVDLDTTERATIVAALLQAETGAVDAGQAAAARGARGAALALMSGTKMSGATLGGSALRPVAIGFLPAALGFQVDLLNMSGRTTLLRLDGLLARTSGGKLVLAVGESTSSLIPPGVAALAAGQGLWLASAGQVASAPVADGADCTAALAMTGVTCTLATFHAGLDVTASAPAPIAGNSATGSLTASLPAMDMRGVKLTVDCAQATSLASALLCRWVPSPRLTVVLSGSQAASVMPTPGGTACRMPPGPCSWTFATGTAASLAPTALGASFFDGTLTTVGWTLEVLQGGNGGTVATTDVATGGNPGGFRRVTLSPRAAPAADRLSSVAAFQLRDDATWDPRSQGALSSVSLYHDHRAAPGPQFVALAVKQDGKYFVATGSHNHYADAQAWTPFADTGLRSLDFVRLPTDLSTQYAEGPDLTTAGGPMTFGYYLGASTGYGGSGYSTTGDLDNWHLTVVPAAAATLHPVWTGCSQTNGAGTCFVNLADDRTVTLSFE
jgi:hypothetical protein